MEDSQGDITIKRMVYIRVNSVAGKLVTPQKVRGGYEKIVKETIQPEKWRYTGDIDKRWKLHTGR